LAKFKIKIKFKKTDSVFLTQNITFIPFKNLPVNQK